MADEASFGDRLAAQVDADIALVAAVRLPQSTREAAARDFLDSGGLFRPPYIEAFDAGYRWGGEAKVTLVSLAPDTERKLDEIIDDYREYDDYRGALLATGLIVGRAGRSIIDGGATPYGSADEAFEALRPDFAPAGEPAMDRELRGCFHGGVGLFAVESYFLMRMRFQDRLDHVSRLQKRDRWRASHWWWRLRNR